MLTIVAVAMFVATLVLVVWQPKGFGIGWTALIGAALALVTTVVHLSDVPTVLGIVWNATGAFVAIVIISTLLDEAGFFTWAALHVARWGRGRGRPLFVLLVLLGAVTSTLFGNDGGAMILTPVVVGIVTALKLGPKATLAFVMAIGFIADTGSIPLVVSNLVNIITADYFHVGFVRYAVVMVPVGLVSIAASLGMLLLYFRRAIPSEYDTEGLQDPASAIKDSLTFRAGWVVLVLLLFGYFVGDQVGIPLSVTAGVGALVLIAIAARQPRFLFGRAGERQISAWQPIKGAPWQVVLFSIGMYLVVYGLNNQGLTSHLAGLFAFFGRHGVLATALGVGLTIAILASIMNNLPTVLIGSLAIAASGATGLTQQVMVHANVIGADLGPKITPIGSLATLLWLHVLDAKGIHIGWGRYFRTGVVLTLPVLVVTLAALGGWMMLVG